MAKMHWKNLDKADEKRKFDKGLLELVTLADVTFGRATLQPGWKWSTSVKPIVKTSSCEAAHTQYVISGRLMIKMDDGTQVELGPGDAAVIPSGHDAWVVGNEPVVIIDLTGMSKYAKS